MAEHYNDCDVKRAYFVFERDDLKDTFIRSGIETILKKYDLGQDSSKERVVAAKELARRHKKGEHVVVIDLVYSFLLGPRGGLYGENPSFIDGFDLIEDLNDLDLL